MALLDASFALITHPNPRQIGTIIPDIVVEEIQHDQLQISEFPVESGAPISDHAYKRPPEIIMRCGFSNSTAQSEGYVQEVYALFLALQAPHGGPQPFNVTTGKRQYQNMLISSLLVTTDQESEYTLRVVVGLKMVIITSTSGGGLSSDPATQADPSQTSGVTNSGQVSANIPTTPVSGNIGSGGLGAGGFGTNPPVFG
jgi:hypothetical protein